MNISAMLEPANLIGGVIFSGIGFVAFVYGKKMGLLKPALLGVALMIYPYFVTDWRVLYAVGVALTVLLWFWRE